METLPYSLEELSSLNRLYIEEQALDITLNPRFSIFHSKGDMHVIIGYEADHTFYNSDSKLMCGIVELKKTCMNGENVYLEKLILPFSNKILYAKFSEEENRVLVVFKKDEVIQKRWLEIDGDVLKGSFDFILDDEYPLIMPLGEYHGPYIRHLIRK